MCQFLFKYVDNNPYQQNYLDYLPYRIASILSQKGFEPFEMPIFTRLPKKKIREIIDLGESTILISIHDGFAYSTKLISDRTNRVSIIANHPEKVKKNQFKKTGVLEEKVNIIKADQYCLVNLSKVLINRHIICAHIDFNIDGENTTYLNKALIEFAIKKNLQLYFANYKTMKNASIKAFIKRANLKLDSKMVIADFIKFINTSSGYNRQFKIYNRNC